METSIFNFEMNCWNREDEEEYDQLLSGSDGVYEDCCKGQESQFYDTAYWDGIEQLLCSDISFAQFHVDDVNPIAEFIHEPIVNNQDDHVFKLINDMDEPVQLDSGPENLKPLAALGILANYRKGGQLKRLQGTRLDQCVSGAIITPAPPQPALVMNGGLPGRVLSTEEVMRVAGARFIQFADHRGIVVGEDEHLAALGFTLSSLSDEETKDVELAHLLFAAAEKVANQQYDRASRLLAHCQLFASPTGNPVQRVVHYFAEALCERIDKATSTSSGWCKKSDTAGVVPLLRIGEETEEKMKVARPSLVAFHRLLPFSEVVQFTAVQAILNAVTTSRVIHIIDLNIRLGLQWTVLLQALSDSRLRPSSASLELVKITAVATSQHAGTTDTGTRLTNFAAGLGISLVFKVVVAADVKELREDMFETADDETLVVYASLALRTMLVRPASLESLMRVARRLRPALMAVVEVEADNNSVSFNRRFIEALFFYSAWFDCCDAAMAPEDPNRIDAEAEFFAGGIRSMVAGEGRERVVREVRLEVWRSFMARFGFEEVELGQMIFYQAGLILNRFGFGGRCTVDMNGKGMTTGWKGTPFLSVSAWKVKSK